MARSTPAAQPLTFPGLLPVHDAPSVDGDVVDVGRLFVSVINGGASPITVTVQTPGVVDGDLAVADRDVVVPVDTTPTLIPLTSPHYKRAVGEVDAGKAYVDYSDVASVTRAVVSL